ncbi:MAG: Fic family protein [Myxococcota bacterium]|nr:Fic family protein [Myxococcota bacterium]
MALKERYPEIDALTALLARKIRRLRAAESAAIRVVMDRVWIHHDCAIDGLVVPLEEIRAALAGQPPADSSLAPVHREVTAHREAVRKTREEAARAKPPLRMPFVLDLYGTFAGERYDPHKSCYRRDVPVHRLYYHDIAAPDRIAYRMKRLIDWAGQPDFRKRHPIAAATLLHHTFMEVFPFPTHSGKIGRLLMNLALMRAGYQPVVLHSADRHRYYESLRGDAEDLAFLVEESMENSLRSSIKLTEQRRMLAML